MFPAQALEFKAPSTSAPEPQRHADLMRLLPINSFPWKLFSPLFLSGVACAGNEDSLSTQLCSEVLQRRAPTLTSRQRRARARAPREKPLLMHYSTACVRGRLRGSLGGSCHNILHANFFSRWRYRAKASMQPHTCISMLSVRVARAERRARRGLEVAKTRGWKRSVFVRKGMTPPYAVAAQVHLCPFG